MGQTAEVTVTRYTREQYENSSEPYDYLYGLRDNLFKQSQEITALDREARACGVKNFKSIWKSYLATVNPERKTVEMANVTDFDGQPMVLKCGEYECTDRGVSCMNPVFGNMTVVCSHPIMPVKRLINFDTQETKMEVAFRRGKNWTTTIVPKEILSTASQIVRLSSQNVGVTSENARDLVRFMSDIESANYDEIPEAQSIGRLGWVRENDFSPYVEGLVFDGMAQYEHAFKAVDRVGDYDKWMDVAKKTRAGRSVVIRIMLAASFASVLIKPLNALPFIAHCWSNFSGIGKTVALMLCGSVWANPQMGEYIKTFSTTNVGMEMMAAFYGSLPYCLDELCLKDGKKEAFDSMIYQFCEGSGKTRGSRNGGVQKSTTWNCCAISTGEEPLTSANSRAGAVNRVLDLNAGDIPMFEDGRETVAILARNYGWAGPDFIDSLKLEGALETIRRKAKEYEIELERNAESKQAISASLVLAADWWAEKQLFHDGKVLGVADIAPFLQTHDSVNINKRAYEWLQDVVASNPARFIPGEFGYSGECWGEASETEAYIIKSIFDRLMKDEGYNSVGFLNWAKGKGLLSFDSDGRNTKKKRIEGLAAPARCVCIKLGADLEEKDESGMEVVNNSDLPW